MAKWQTAYWGETDVEVYEIANGRTSRLFSGPVDALAPAKRWPKRRVLIIGRGNFIRLRKLYPPAKIDKLRQAVAVEAQDLFPLLKPVLHCRIHETHATHVLLDVWAWEQGPADQLRAAFPFQYAIPEDLAFLSLPPLIHIYQSGAMVHVVACGGGKFFDAISCRAADFSAGDIEKFLMSLSGNASVIGEIRLYGDRILMSQDKAALPIKRFPLTSYHLCLDAIKDSTFKFRPFRISGGGLPLLNRSLIFRYAVYAVLVLGVSLLVTMKNYDQALTDSRILSKAIDKEIVRLEAKGGRDKGDPDAVKEFQERIKGDLSPLRILDVLASDLPEGSNLKSLSLNDGVVEAVVLSRDPLSVVKRLGGSEGIHKLSLKGSPVRDTSTGVYSCTFSLEIKP